MSNAFPVIYARDVKAATGFYEGLRFENGWWCALGPIGEPEASVGERKPSWLRTGFNL
jgi:hypothetical protein